MHCVVSSVESFNCDFRLFIRQYYAGFNFEVYVSRITFHTVINLFIKSNRFIVFALVGPQLFADLY